VLKSPRAISVATLFLGAALLASCSTTKTLNTTDVQDAISKGLTEQIGGTYSVTCPADVEAKSGATSTCDVKDTATGETATVTVTQTDDNGTFDWKVTAAAGSSASPVPAPSSS
jgi:hypothetical protein